MFGWLARKTQQFFGAPRSGMWPRVRREHLLREPICQACGTDQMLEVHHIKPLAAGGSELDPENLITLCGGTRNCHWSIGHAFNWRSYRPDVRHVCRVVRESMVCRS